MEEREEGEITEGELSDISSEEEYLLRQRLQVLESYNNVLERKEAKRRCSVASNHSKQRVDPTQRCGNKSNTIYEVLLPDLSDISGSDLENSIILNIPKKKDSQTKRTKLLKTNKTRNEGRNTCQNKKRCEKITKHKILEKKESNRHSKLKSHKEKYKKHNGHKKTIDSSDETDYEYRNKRRKLQQSVQIHNNKADLTSTLKTRLMNMFSDKTNSLPNVLNYPSCDENDLKISEKNKDHPSIAVSTVDSVDVDVNKKNIDVEPHIDAIIVSDESQNYSSDMIVDQIENNKDPLVEGTNDKLNDLNNTASDDDIEILRQNALQTKSHKQSVVHQPDHISDSEDSDELRIICLRSTLLKKAIEMKRKKKLRKRISTMSSIDDILARKLKENDCLGEHSRDNTDIESVDMEIGVSDSPDIDDKVFKDDEHNTLQVNELPEGAKAVSDTDNKQEHVGEDKPNEHCLSAQLKEDLEKSEDLEEDEDLLRAKLLTSLSNNLQKLCKSDKPSAKSDNKAEALNKHSVAEKQEPEPKRFIINIGESDSGSDNETTKNLTKMHMKLAENVDFQQRLDMFLKNAREEAEKKTLPQELPAPKSKSPEKFVPKAVNHLPKSGQLEYRRLVKRVEELERLKQSRQAALNGTPTNIPNNKNAKITLMGNELRAVQWMADSAQTENRRPVQTVPDLETQIALSRKRIATESSKVLRLKEESNKLWQRYKLAQAEVRNTRTAITLNKREVGVVQASLASMRHQHQLLLKRSTTHHNREINSTYGKPYKNLAKLNVENNDSKAILRNLRSLQNLTVSVVNDLKEKKNIPDKLSVQLDFSTNKKTVTMPKLISNESSVSAVVENLTSKCTTTNAQLNITPTTSAEKALTADSGATISQGNKDVIVSVQKVNARQEAVPRETSNQTITTKITENVKGIIETTANSSELPDDYRSPLASMKIDLTWKGDPNGILCPYEVLGACKDTECRYQHPETRH